MQATNTVDPWRWREWARSLADARRAGGRSRDTGVTRRRNPLHLALARRGRMWAWIDSHTHVLHRHSREGDRIDVRPLIRFSWHHDSPLQRILRGAGVAPGFTSRAEPSAPAYEAIHTTLRAAKTTLREIVERTRRIEERALATPRLALRGKQIELEARPAARQVPKALSDDWWKPEPESARHRPSVPVLNVDQIAESVLRQLDHRVSAWRERMGRR